MKRLKNILVFFLITFFCIGAVACKDNGGLDPDTHLLTFYTYRDVGVVDGTEDEVVAEAIGNKFFEDTGIKIKLDVKLYTQADLPIKVDMDWIKKTADLDGVIHYISEDAGCATLKYATEEDTVKDMAPLLETYGKNILAKISENDTDHFFEKASYVRCGDEFKRNYITSVTPTSRYGMLIRKDLMRSVQSITNLDPEDYDVMNDGYKNMTITQFNDLVYALKENVSSIKYVIAAYPWDLNNVIAPVFETDAYTIQQDSDGRYVPTQFTTNMAEYSQQLYEWARDGIWENESLNATNTDRRGWFSLGQAAVFASTPTIDNLIGTARYLQTANPNAEYMMIAPLADENGEVHGNKKGTDPDAMIIPEKSTDAEVVVQYIDWLYSDPENYELALYGVKGTHWIEGEEKTINGQVYKTWAYPDAKVAEFNENPPYSGKFCILKNINVSNRIRADYNMEESKWYSLVRDIFPSYAGNAIEGIWIGTVPREYANQYQEIDGTYVNNLRGYVWSGKAFPDGKSALEAFTEYASQKKASCKDYLDWLNDFIAQSKNFFSELFGE